MIPLPGFLGDALAARIAAHGLGEHGLVMHQDDGRPLDHRRFRDMWRATLKTASGGEVRFHDRRHEFASTLLSAGVSTKAVAEWLGHASSTVTLRTYAHLMPVDDDRARRVPDDAFNPPRAILGTAGAGGGASSLVRSGEA